MIFSKYIKTFHEVYVGSYKLSPIYGKLYDLYNERVETVRERKTLPSHRGVDTEKSVGSVLSHITDAEAQDR